MATIYSTTNLKGTLTKNHFPISVVFSFSKYKSKKCHFSYNLQLKTKSNYTSPLILIPLCEQKTFFVNHKEGERGGGLGKWGKGSDSPVIPDSL